MLDVSRIAPELRLAADGIWYAAEGSSVSYPPEGNQACFQVEDSSFWFRHRNACIAAAVRNFPPPDDDPIFDIGGGNGFVSMGLVEAGFETVLVEPGLHGALNGKRRGLSTVICATTASANFAQASLAGIGVFDVVEHIEDDLAFLASLHSLLKPGGRLYATVPAHPALWSDEDVAAGHFRRYTSRSFASIVERAGFTLDYLTYFFRPLPLPILMLRALPYRLGFGRASEVARDHRPGGGRVAAMLDLILKSEVQHIAAKRPMPFGASCLLVANARQ